MQDQDTTVVQTVACDTGRCGSCKGVVFSLTTAHLDDCGHGCHDPAPVDEELELEALAEAEADRLSSWDFS